MSSLLSSIGDFVGVRTDDIVDTKEVAGVFSALTKNITQAKDSILATPKIEILIREATNDDMCPPTNTQKQELAQASHYYAEFPIIMEWIWARISEPPHNWRRIYKALLVIDHLLKCGSDQVLKEVQIHRMTIERLQRFRHLDENDRDVGANVRERAKQIIQLLRDPELLREERRKARENKNKYMESMSSDSYYPSNRYGSQRSYSRSASSQSYGRSDRYSDSGRYNDDWNDRSYEDSSSYTRETSKDPDAYTYEEEEEQHQEKDTPSSSGVGLIDFGTPAAETAPTPDPSPSVPFDFFSSGTSGSAAPSLFPDPPHSGGAPAPHAQVDDFFDPRATAAHHTSSAPTPTVSGPAPPLGVGAPLSADTEEEWDSFVKYDAKAEEKKNDLWNKHQGLIDLGKLSTPSSGSAVKSQYRQPIGAMPTSAKSMTMGPIGTATGHGGAYAHSGVQMQHAPGPYSHHHVHSPMGHTAPPPGGSGSLI